MNDLTIATLGIAATISVAAVAALFKIVQLLINFSAEQTEYRHKLRDDLTSIVLNSENRITRRVERLEQYSIGWREASTFHRNPEDGE